MVFADLTLFVIIDWIFMSANTAQKNIQLADRVYNFDWNLAEPQKLWAAERRIP